MAAKPKVYATRIGFHDTVVAAPNQKAALAAWDVRENLFAQGAATLTEDAQAEKAALAQPGIVLRRPAGSDQPFKRPENPPSGGEGGAAKPRRAGGRVGAQTDSPKPGGTRPPPPTPPLKGEGKKPDRRPLDEAERALAQLDAEAREQAKAISGRRKALERERDRARRVYEREGGTR